MVQLSSCIVLYYVQYSFVRMWLWYGTKFVVGMCGSVVGGQLRMSSELLGEIQNHCALKVYVLYCKKNHTPTMKLAKLLTSLSEP